MKLILVRHCETDWNREGKLQGHTDTSLNEQGWLQAEELVKKLKDSEIKKIISSDLRRSRETAEVLNSVLKVPIKFDPRLRECSFGLLEGKKREEISKIYRPHRVETENLWHGSYIDYDFIEFGGENRERVLRRHLSLLDEISDSETEEPILLVGHGTGLNTLLAHFKKPPLSRGEFIVIDYPPISETLGQSGPVRR